MGRTNRLTELEKTILITFLILTKGSLDMYLSRDSIVLKFPKIQRKMVRKYIDKLVKENFLFKHPTQYKYKLSEDGLKVCKRLLIVGVQLVK